MISLFFDFIHVVASTWTDSVRLYARARVAPPGGSNYPLVVSCISSKSDSMASIPVDAMMLPALWLDWKRKWRTSWRKSQSLEKSRTVSWRRYYIRLEQAPMPSPIQPFSLTQPMNHGNSKNATVKLSRDGLLIPQACWPLCETNEANAAA